MGFGKYVQVIFSAFLALYIGSVYLYFHLRPSLQSDNAVTFGMGTNEAIIFGIFYSLFLVCFLRTFFTHPGRVPDTPAWWCDPEDCESENPRMFLESKGNGNRRYCQWCEKFKPDRTHHCRKCGECVLKMDHHCPWFGNCIGFMNYKWFLLAVFYATMASTFVSVSLARTCYSFSFEGNWYSSFSMVMIVTAEILAILLAVFFLLFFLAHIWLGTAGLTTLEWCEKRWTNSASSPYDLGVSANLRAMLGPNPLLWLLPIIPPEGDGINFVTEESSLIIVDQEVGNPRRSSKVNTKKKTDRYEREQRQVMQRSKKSKHNDLAPG